MNGLIGARKKKLKEQGIVTITRRIMKSGNSYYVALPQEFMKKHGLKERDEVGVVSDSIVKIIPMTEML